MQQQQTAKKQTNKITSNTNSVNCHVIPDLIKVPSNITHATAFYISFFFFFFKLK